MTFRKYYSARKRGTRIDLNLAKELLCSLFAKLEQEGCFQEALGFDCVDAGWVSGTLGSDIPAAFFRVLRKRNLWPFSEYSASWTEEDTFDVVEFVYDFVSRPTEGTRHGWDGCCFHWSSFDKSRGRAEYREHVNHILIDYEDGYELSADGEIRHAGDKDMRSLLHSSLPEYDPANVEQRVEAAVAKFMRYRSSAEDRRDAVKALADVLEFIRPKLKTAMLSKDEADLFNIANNFGVRHHNRQQKTAYEARTWLTWMFYVYLATIHAVIRILKRNEAAAD